MSLCVFSTMFNLIKLKQAIYKHKLTQKYHFFALPLQRAKDT